MWQREILLLVGSKICYENNPEIRPAGGLATDGPKAQRRTPADADAAAVHRERRGTGSRGGGPCVAETALSIPLPNENIPGSDFVVLESRKPSSRREVSYSSLNWGR